MADLCFFRPVLHSIVSHLSSSVHLFYYLTCAPSSTLKINEFFTQSPFLGLHDRFTVAFGMLSFASLPDWAEEEEGESEVRKLVELGCECLLSVSLGRSVKKVHEN